MGSAKDDIVAYKDEKPRHKVRISRSFYLGKYKVTVGQFKRFVKATNYQTQAEKAGDKKTWKKPGLVQTDEHPVVCVSWVDAVAFCQWLAKETGATVRLPRAAEWEYSCRAKTTTKFYFGDDEADLGDYAWYSKNTGYGTKPCGLKKPNAFGLYDMHGLAYEWCYDGDRRYKDRDEKDPVGPTSAGADRVNRGGSFGSGPRECRAANRIADVPSTSSPIISFRVLVVR
jgi:formylglycine-generating enzyme required for sulfatase activity